LNNANLSILYSQKLEPLSIQLLKCILPSDTRINISYHNFYRESIDMWGVGIILYTMLIGEPPFTEPNIPKLLEKVRSADYDRDC
jgi:serine/threonine protein kinase